MPEQNRGDEIEKFLADQKSIEDRKQGLIDDLLRQKEDAIKAFDGKLEKLGYHAKDSAGKRSRNHHKKSQPPADAPAKPSTKPKT